MKTSATDFKELLKEGYLEMAEGKLSLGEPSELNSITQKIIGAGINVHKSLGPGFTEQIYARAMQHELKESGVPFSTEQSIRIKYKDKLLGLHRLDLLVADSVVVELKAVYQINNFHVAQVLSYLKTSKKRLGLILNFARSRIEIKRVAL